MNKREDFENMFITGYYQDENEAESQECYDIYSHKKCNENNDDHGQNYLPYAKKSDINNLSVSNGEKKWSRNEVVFPKHIMIQDPDNKTGNIDNEPSNDTNISNVELQNAQNKIMR